MRSNSDKIAAFLIVVLITVLTGIMFVKMANELTRLVNTRNEVIEKQLNN